VRSEGFVSVESSSRARPEARTVHGFFPGKKEKQDSGWKRFDGAAATPINLDYLYIIRSVTYAHIPKGPRDPGNLAHTAKKMIMVGYSRTSKAYLLMGPDHRHNRRTIRHHSREIAATREPARHTRLWDPTTVTIVERYDFTADKLQMYEPTIDITHSQR
ncbi:MAG: hypothetical protein BJ554DRAFT_7872, partial [Olpidium bornovanus]